ncbi:MAG: lipopolysaccharide biosynthesis protein, partial [Nocardioidaceae bacterium]
SHALLAFFALSNADVLIARVTLDEQQSGLYAGGLILAKAVLFLPQFVVVIAFPSMSASDARFAMMLRALGLVLLIGLGATAVALTLPELAVAFVGGEAYGALAGTIWAFAGLGTLLAMIQLLIYNVVAQQAKRAVLVVWLGLVTLFALSSAVSSVGFLLTAVVAVEALVLLALMGLGLRGRARTGSAANGG